MKCKLQQKAGRGDPLHSRERPGGLLVAARSGLSLLLSLFREGRNAFYKWIHDSVAAGKPYNQMASELIAAQGNNNFDQTNGQVNFIALGVVTGGPRQDIMDQQAANIATTFLGMSNLNCLLCHNGKGHLDTLNLWGSKTTRVQAWGMAAFMAHTWPRSLTLPVDPAATNPALTSQCVADRELGRFVDRNR